MGIRAALATEPSRRLLFRLGTAAVAVGVIAHLPMFFAHADMGYMMASMRADDPLMIAGMALILLGIAFAGYGLLPADRSEDALAGNDIVVESASESLGRAHWLLVGAVVVGVVIDTMKPATLGLLLPGMGEEYGLANSALALFPLSALSGTVLGSVVWGWLADVYGRRATILLSAIMFAGTSICGFMPTFAWNVAMCFMMGLAAGGMLPVCYALLTEAIPRRYRGLIMVLAGGLGTLGGFFAATALSSLLQPIFGWRILWFMGLPTGLLLIFVARYMPESPRFLAHHGRVGEAIKVMAHFGTSVRLRPRGQQSRADARDGGFALLLSRRYAGTTVALSIAGLGWGLLNFGLILWLPAKLAEKGFDIAVSSAILAQSAFLALPTIIAIALAYHWWSTKWSFAISLLVGGVGLLGVFQFDSGLVVGVSNPLPFLLLLLIGTNGIIATILPYAAESYPTAVRGRGTGKIAASTKFGGLVAQIVALLGADPSLSEASLILVAVMTLAVVLVSYFGGETRGAALDDGKVFVSA